MARGAATVLWVSLLLLVLTATSMRVDSGTGGSDVCTASGLDDGLGSCLASHAKDDCCDFLVNDIIYPCGTTEICALDLSTDVKEFFTYCRFKCHGLASFADS